MPHHCRAEQQEPARPEKAGPFEAGVPKEVPKPVTPCNDGRAPNTVRSHIKAKGLPVPHSDHYSPMPLPEVGLEPRCFKFHPPPALSTKLHFLQPQALSSLLVHVSSEDPPASAPGPLDTPAPHLVQAQQVANDGLMGLSQQGIFLPPRNCSLCILYSRQLVHLCAQPKAASTMDVPDQDQSVGRLESPWGSCSDRPGSTLGLPLNHARGEGFPQRHIWMGDLLQTSSIAEQAGLGARIPDRGKQVEWLEQWGLGLLTCIPTSTTGSSCAVALSASLCLSFPLCLM